MRVTLLSSLLAALTAALLPAQATHVVGPSGVPQIRDAIAAAAPGDLILVEPGTYGQFVVDKTLTIRAITDGTVHVDLDLAVSPARTTIALTIGEVVHIAGIAFDQGWDPAGGVNGYHAVEVSGGDITLEHCDITSRQHTLGALKATGTDLHLIGSSVTVSPSRIKASCRDSMPHPAGSRRWTARSRVRPRRSRPPKTSRESGCRAAPCTPATSR